MDKTIKNWQAISLTSGNYDWARIERAHSAWIDLWAREDGRWDIYENGKNGKETGALGFCEMPVDAEKALARTCPGSTDDTVISLTCFLY